MPTSLTLASGRWHPGYSLLGLLLRRLAADRLRAGAWLVVALVGLGVLLLALAPMAGYLDGPSRWIAAAGAGGLLTASLVGWQPSVRARVEGGRLHVLRGREHVMVSFEDIERVKCIGGRVYWQHYRRYRRVRAFVNRVPDEVLLVETADVVLALGANAASRQRLLQLLPAEAPAVVEQRLAA